MQNNEFFSDPARENAIKQIHNFLERPGLHTGGVLLVTGDRGSGKTRLVDEALSNNRNECKDNNKFYYLLCILKSWFNPLFGKDPNRERKEVSRPPTGTKRIVLPIYVDPFFPHISTLSDKNNAEKEATTKTKDSTQEESKKRPDQDVLDLLRNVVFALTSFIDARGASYKHGRTLGAWLGWCKLWFSRAALYRPQGLPNPLVIIFLLIPLSYLSSYLLVRFLIEIPINNGWWHFLGQCIGFSLSILIAWVLLRWRDLRGLRSMGSQLYDLAHAQVIDKEIQFELHHKFNTNSKLQPKLLALFGLIIGGGSGIGLIEPESLKVMNLEGTPKLILGIGLVIGMVSFISGISQRRMQHAVFGEENKGWMITLIRRYLFQLHRAGFEPVLVVDEIDKLKRDDESQDTNSPFSDELGQFEQSLCQVKQSLCAEFIWILIDNGRIIEDVIQARRNGMKGEMSTLVQSEVFVESLPYDEFKRYVNKTLNTCTPPHDEQLTDLWLKSRGLFFNFHHTINDIGARRKAFEKLSKTMQKQAMLIARAIDYLSESNMGNVASYVSYGSQQTDLSSLLKTSNWHRMQILNGMLSLAQQLYDPQFIAPSWKDMEIQREQHTPKDGGIGDNPLWLEHLGKMALLMLLDAVYQGHNGLENIIDHKGNGIDLAQQRMNNLQPLRLIVK